MIKGSLQMKILYRGVFVEDFPSPKMGPKLTVLGGGIRQGKLWVASPKMGQKLTVFGGLDRENCDTPKNVFSRAGQEKL